MTRSAPAEFDLSEYLPYLVNRVGVGMVDAFMPALERFGITLGMWRVLAALWSGGDSRLVDLAQRTSIEVSTLSRTVSELFRRGLVSRERKGQDAREVRIALSRKGRALTAQVIPAALEIETRMAAAIPQREQAELRRLLKRLYRNLADAAPAAPVPPPRKPLAAGDE